MKTVEVIEPFTGYPDGKERSFRVGEEANLPDDFADLIVAKGHAREPEAAPASPPAHDMTEKRSRKS